MKRQLAEMSGRIGEQQAAHYLRDLGWQILGERIKTKLGEIDLIARLDNIICFVEVKWRQSPADLDDAIDAYRLRRVAQAAESIAHIYANAGEDIRIDVILLAPGAEPRHIINAWQP